MKKKMSLFCFICSFYPLLSFADGNINVTFMPMQNVNNAHYTLDCVSKKPSGKISRIVKTARDEESTKNRLDIVISENIDDAEYTCLFKVFTRFNDCIYQSDDFIISRKISTVPKRNPRQIQIN